jgi:hypothetical protein
MIEVSVRDQHKINRRQVRYTQPRTSKPFQYEQPPRKVGVDDYALPADLYEEARVSDEGDAKLTVGCQSRLVGLS